MGRMGYSGFATRSRHVLDGLNLEGTGPRVFSCPTCQTKLQAQIPIQYNDVLAKVAWVAWDTVASLHVLDMYWTD